MLKADEILANYDLVDMQRAYALIRTEEYVALEKVEKDKSQGQSYEG